VQAIEWITGKKKSIPLAVRSKCYNSCENVSFSRNSKDKITVPIPPTNWKELRIFDE
jgi:hypothetical protein